MKRGITDLVNDWIESIKSSLEAYGKQSDETLTSLYAAAPELTADRLQTHADLARFD